MSKEPQTALEVITSTSGLKVFGEEVVDHLGNKGVIHESSVSEDEGGPFVWLTLQESTSTEAVGLLLGAEQVEAIRDRLDLALKTVWGQK